MNLLFIFAIVLIAIVFGIFFQRLIHSPILVGIIFFSVFLLISAITGNTTFIILAVVLAVIAFISALADCLISNNDFFRINNCIRTQNTNGNNTTCNRRNFRNN